MRPRRPRAAALAAALIVPVLGALAGTGAAAGSTAPPPVRTAATTTAAATAAAEWQNGTADQDEIFDCWLQTLRPGVSAQASWLAENGRIPASGETFYVRGYIGLVGLPCSGSVAIAPEFMPPVGVEWADDAEHPVRWAITKYGEQQTLRTDKLSYSRGRNGGVVFGTPDDTFWTLRQGQVLEIQVPVRATRELKGPATQAPDCYLRNEGVEPCEIARSGDHLQVAFAVGGHTGSKRYVTPYVPLFASAPPPSGGAGGTTGPGTGTGTGAGTGSGTGTGTGVGKATSTTTASFRVSRRSAGRAVVTVTSTPRASGKVVVTDRGRTIASGRLTKGKVVLRLPRLPRGKHVLVASYTGSASVERSASKPHTVRLR